MKKLYRTLILVISLFMIISCGTNYSVDGKDVLDYLGDGRFQFLRAYDSDNKKYTILMDESNENINTNYIETKVYDYKVKSNFAYILGEKGYTKINVKSGDIKQSTNINDFNDDDIKIFEKLKSSD